MALISLASNYKNPHHFKQNLKIGRVVTSLNLFIWKVFFTHINGTKYSRMGQVKFMKDSL